ncbi:hypothetical protein [uncultured Paraglaciecola sp.]|uniref:hypothetical protein n=1 Tax=uncultured Paraglaciecola sp. TaxID=1765024 RepID=UPI0030DB7A91|tara:strand:- start:3982 stop:4251 length:270 start_codon:yes stop_codon:yes gene_type:complete
MLKYTLVLVLLLCVAASVLYDWHDNSHKLQSENHCALCLTVHNLGHSLPAGFPPALALPLAGFTIEITIKRYLPLSVRTAGNRDPPSVF